MIIAHRDGETKKQSLEEHSLNVAKMGRLQAESIGQGDVLFLLGLYHDIGKADKAFQDKLEKFPNKHVDHSYAGAKYLHKEIQCYLKKQNIPINLRTVFAEIVAYVISAHHGLYDILLTDQTVDIPAFDYSKLRYRIKGLKEGYRFIEDILPFASQLEALLPSFGYQNLDDLIQKAFDNFQLALGKLEWADATEESYYQACLVRLYLSLLKNADIMDTINAYELKLESGSPAEQTAIIHSYFQKVEALYESFGQPTKLLNKVRTQIADRVKERGSADSTGIYRLNLPTGAGKTNVSLRYAVHQMIQQHKSRFFYITPFLSVLEQNAGAIKKVIGETGVLEHHSNVVKKQEKLEESAADEKAELQAEYLIDSWDSPVVLTSMVQFFQTLFKTQSANIRRFSSLIDSVLILDEVQSLPIEVTTLFNLTLNFLSRVMNTTVVLCTATQPAYDSEAIRHPLCYGGKEAEPADIVALTADEQAVFARTELRKFKDDDAPASLSEVVATALKHEESTLIILNTKPAVARLYELLKNQTDRPLYQLSTNMCPQHRWDVISAIKNDLKAGVPLICISTQLIEAGVDVDFRRVIRSYAGIDSIVQASGRCNREGQQALGQVTLVNLTNEEENLSSLKEIRYKKDATESILYGKTSPIDIAALNQDFFEKYYANNKNLMDYPLGDWESVYDYLSKNTFAGSKIKGTLKQSFKTAGQKMNLIKDESIGVLVYYDDGKGPKQLEALENQLSQLVYPTAEALKSIKEQLKSLQPYTVNLRDRDPLLAATRAYLDGQVLFLQKEYYDDKTGIKKEADSLIL